MTEEEFEQRLAASLKRQAEQAEDWFKESGAVARMGQPGRQSGWGVGLRRLPLIAAAVVAAIAVGLWAGSQAPRSGVGAVPTPSPLPTAASSVPTRSPSPTESSPLPMSPSPRAGEPDAENLVEVIGGELVAYSEQSTESKIVDRVAEGRVVWLASDQQSNGEVWVRIQFASFAWGGQEIFAWAMAQNRLRPIDLACPELVDVASLGAMSAQERLHCFEDTDLTLVGFADAMDAESPYSGTPAWIAEPSQLVLRGSDAPQADTGQIAVHVDPASGISVPLKEWVEVTGHFDDPVAAQCLRQRAVESLSVESTDEQVHSCRQRLVVTAVQVVDPPTFPTPGPDANRGRRTI